MVDEPTPPAPEFNDHPKRPPATWQLQSSSNRGEVYGYGGFTVISRVGRKLATDPPVYLWWLEILRWGRAPTDKQCAHVLRAFGMKGAEEAPSEGPSRHFMLPVQQQ